VGLVAVRWGGREAMRGTVGGTVRVAAHMGKRGGLLGLGFGWKEEEEEDE